MKHKLFITCMLAISLSACFEQESDLPVIAEVDIGLLGPNAKLSEACLHDTPYYLLVSTLKTGKPGSKSALAVRYNSDGSIPSCLTEFVKKKEPLIVQRFGELKPSRSVGLLCLDHVSYYYVYNLYTAGLSPARKPNGSLVSCDP